MQRTVLPAGCEKEEEERRKGTGGRIFKATAMNEVSRDT